MSPWGHFSNFLVAVYTCAYVTIIIHAIRHDRVTKQRAKNEGGRAKPKNGARSCALEDHGSQIEGVAKWKLRRCYCLLSHHEDPVLWSIRLVILLARGCILWSHHPAP
ncbi:hypothetical protein ALC53_04099 [Atta colombica]|uniref:Uncharacterized protein n=1 Tax=Atta colombica TaxID=520822 RepID=A0A195BL71_9HYME|nr:hypothetical protein ALC53_04099 [Atta colombica]